VVPRNYVLDGGPDFPCEGAILRGKMAAHCKIWGLCAVSCAKTVEPIEMAFGIWTLVGPRNHVLDGVQIPTLEREVLRRKTAGPGHVQWSISYTNNRRRLSVPCYFLAPCASVNTLPTPTSRPPARPAWIPLGDTLCGYRTLVSVSSTL